MEPKAPLADCDNCPLKDCPPVYGSGPAKADIVLVGEAPGRDEVKSGIPFSGVSGKLMNSILLQNGIKREDIYVTNACLCRPPDNAKPTAKAIQSCRDRLLAEIRVRRPNIIVCVGGSAAQSVLQTKEGITSLRLQQEQVSPELGVRVIPTFHPAYALRSPDNYPSIVKDIGRIHLRQVGWEPTKWNLYDSTDLALHALEQQSAYSRLVVDIERDYDANEPNTLDAKFLSIAISHRPGASCVYPKVVVDDPRFRLALQRIFAKPNSDIRFGYQRGQFDIQYEWEFAPEARVDDDSLLLHYSTDERKGTHDLEQMAVEILHAPQYKSDTRSYLPYKGASLRHLPPKILYEYNGCDADVTHRLIPILEKEMREDGTDWVYYNLLIPGTNVLAHVERRGIRFDRERAEALAATYDRELEGKESRLQQWVRNPRSFKQVLAALHEEGFTWVKSTDKDTIKNLDSDLARGVLDYRKMQKMVSTYMRGLAKQCIDDEIHANFNLNTTETGRLSSSHPNLQNIPRTDTEIGREIRDLFYARPGYTLISADYQAIELRLMAEIAGDEYMLQAFREGRNLHKERAERIWGPNYTRTQYVWGKNIIFGSIYRGQAAMLANKYDVPVDVVLQIQRDMHAASPAIGEYWAETDKLVQTQGYLRSDFGRLRRFWLVTAQNWKDISKEAYNFRISSPASDLTLTALIKLYPILQPYDCHPIITIHDDNTFECPTDAVPDVLPIIKEVMEDTGRTVPTPVEFKVGPRWGSQKEVVI